MEPFEKTSMIDQDGIRPDPDKTAALTKMQPGNRAKTVHGFGESTGRIAEISQPLRELLRSNITWIWGQSQQQSFENVKAELNKPVVLKLYNPTAKTKVSADASSYGLGAVLLQADEDSPDSWKPVAYASRSLSDTEKRYAQIEKEALASTWASEKFRNYILGRPFILESDHKPLLNSNSKHLDPDSEWPSMLNTSFYMQEQTAQTAQTTQNSSRKSKRT